MSATKSAIEIGLNASVLSAFDGIGDGIRRAAKGDFSGLPENPSWNEVLCLGCVIDGYEVASMITDEHIQSFHGMKEQEYESSGRWTENVLELWSVLFYYNRMNHWNGGLGFNEGERFHKLTVSAYHALRTRLMSATATAGIIFKTT